MSNYFSRFKNSIQTKTGFEDHLGNSNGRVLAKDGKSKVRTRGFAFLKHISLFHTLIDLNIWTFWTICTMGFVVINFVFAALYFIIGPENIDVPLTLSPWRQFEECIYFSSHTITTVGYGHMSPHGLWANLVASFEAFFGFMSFAVITGLVYSRFAMPKAHLAFSNNVLISPYKETKALMMRMATYKNNELTDVSCELLAAITITENGVSTNTFVPLRLETNHVQTLVLNWTVVHPIDENSPLYKMTEEKLKEANFEILVIVKAYDEGFSAYVQQRTSYTSDEIKWNARFIPMFYHDKKVGRTILEIDKLSTYELVDSSTF